ncbi:MAG: phage baseplate assembly protein V [Methylococcaceae bacterium]
MKNISGVVIGIVKEVDATVGAIKVDFPWMSPPQRSHWSPIATLMGGKGRGVYFMPEIDDEVLVAFQHGEFEHPFVIGFLWNGMDAPPRADPKRRVIHSVNGHVIEIYDPDISDGDKGYIRLKDAHGNFVELANARITIQSVAAININAPSVVINGRPVAPVPNPI